MHKVINLFGEEQVVIQEGPKRKKTIFTDYEGFVDKFKPKKTTDDCYTPDDVYALVLDYVGEKIDLEGRQIIRPFYPGGDYESIQYPTGCIVIDNPPFSIITKICKFYISRGIDFFLFAPHLTLFGVNVDCTKLVVFADIIYENGANVKTSFLTNIFTAGVIGDADLHQRFKRLNQSKKHNLPKLPKYIYPANVLTVSMVSWIVQRGISVRFDKEHLSHCSALESQKAMKKAIYGNGFLISDKAAADKAAAEKAAAENEPAEKAAAAAERAAAEKAAAENAIVWELSKKELEIIHSLGLF